MAGLAHQSAQRYQVHRRLGEHHPARGIQLAGQDIQAVSQPGSCATKGLGAGAHSGVQGCPWRGGKLPCQAANGVGVDAGMACDGFRRKAQGSQLQQVLVFHQPGSRAGTDQVLRKQRVHHGHQQQGIGARADKMEIIGNAGGFRAARVDDDQLAATFLELLHPPPEIRHRHQAAVGGHGVATDTDKQVSAVDIRNGEQHLVPEHLQAGQHMGQLVVRGG